MWGRKTKALGDQIAALAKALENHVMALDARITSATSQSAIQSALEALVTKTLSNQAEQVDAIGKLFSVVNEVTLHKAARKLGQAGGRKKQQNKVRKATGCAVCAGDTTATASDIARHLGGHATMQQISAPARTENGEPDGNRTDQVKN